MTHTPHVERGVFVGGALAIGPAAFDSTAGGAPVSTVFQMSATVGAGWRSDDPGLPAALATLRVPFFFGGGDLDAYVEAPERWFGGFDVGAGVDAPWANARGLMGYLQLGRRNRTGLGWFTTQGAGRLVTTDGRRSGLLWFPTIGYGGSATHAALGQLFATAIVGHQISTCPDGRFTCDGNYARPLFFVGIAAQGNLLPALMGSR